MDVNLVMFRKKGVNKSFALPSSVTVIGRRQDCDLCIPLMVVSRRHCELNIDQDRLTLRDLGSRNGTFLNGRPVDEAQLNPGDKIQVGPVSFAIQVDGVPSSDSAILQPPKHIASEKDLPQHPEELINLDDVDTLQDHNISEILNGLNEKAAGNNKK